MTKNGICLSEKVHRTQFAYVEMVDNLFKRVSYTEDDGIIR